MKTKTHSHGARTLRTHSKVEKILTLIGSYAGVGAQESIVEAILADHKALHKLIKELKSEDTPAARKKMLYPKFASLLLSHSTAEEKALYAASVGFRDLKAKTLEGTVEHDVARSLMKSIPAKPTPAQLNVWLAKVQVLAELTEHHLKEEEEDLLPVVRREMKVEEQIKEAKKFFRLRAQSQKIQAKENLGALAQLG